MMFGKIDGWLFKGLGGIKPDPEQPRFKHILLRPNFVTGLNHSEVKRLTPNCWIVSKWSKKGKKVTYEVEIPANTTATFYMPDNVKDTKDMELTSGKHSIEIQLGTCLNFVQQ